MDTQKQRDELQYAVDDWNAQYLAASEAATDIQMSLQERIQELEGRQRSWKQAIERLEAIEAILKEEG
jgi:hypothetical protein